MTIQGGLFGYQGNCCHGSHFPQLTKFLDFSRISFHFPVFLNVCFFLKLKS